MKIMPNAVVLRASALASIFFLAVPSAAVSADNHDHHHHMHAGSGMQAVAIDQHAQHRQMMNTAGYQRAIARYPVPSLALLDMQGNTVDISELLNTDQPIAVNFIFTSCTTICPIMSATFSQAQRQLGVDAKHIKWVSISIDPEHDTPEKLRAYARQYGADSNWHFLTGDLDNIISLQKSFAVFRGDKSNHAPTTLLRAGRDQPWLRLDGLTSSAELVREYRQLASVQN
jgi:protein SCO1/2